jgi:two-component system, OmpR family, aerobic respiration control sensor histidine kinase ArcB
MKHSKQSHSAINKNHPIRLSEVTTQMPGCIYWKDLSGCYIGCNNQFLEILMFDSTENIIGKTDYDLWPDQAEELKNNDLTVIKSRMANCFEEFVVTPSGKQMYFISMKAPLLDDDQKVIGIIGNSLDITKVMHNQFLLKSEKDIAEKKSSEALTHLNNIVACVPGSIYWKNKNSVYMGCNDYMVSVAGLNSTADIVGKNDYELWPDQAETLIKNDQEVMLSGKPIEVEEWVVLPNGEHRFFTVVKTPLRDENGNIVGIIGNSLDVTELKKTKDQLAENFKELDNAYKSRNRFIYVVSHEIRGPISNAEYVN